MRANLILFLLLTCLLFDVNSSISLCESVWCHYVCLRCILMCTLSVWCLPYTCAQCSSVWTERDVFPLCVLHVFLHELCVAFWICIFNTGGQEMAHFSFFLLIHFLSKSLLSPSLPHFDMTTDSFVHSQIHVKEVVCCCILCDITTYRLQYTPDPWPHLPAGKICASYWSRFQ